MTEKIKFAVVGQGHIGKRHAEMIRRDERAELVALCDVLPKETLQLKDSPEPFFSSIDDLLHSSLDIDVVNICTPNGYHADYAIKALDTHRHVVIEKPVALTKNDAEIILNKSQEVSRDVFCVMQNRYSPPSVWLKQMVDEKVLGDIYLVQLNCFWNRDDRYYRPDDWHGDARLDGGTLFTQFSHFIDIMYWLFGDITNIKGNFHDFNHQLLTDFEDSGVVLFDFVKGGMGVLNYSTAIWDNNFESSITIIGSKGTVKVAGQYMNEVVYCHVKDYDMPELNPCNPPNDYGPYKGSAQNHHYVIGNVVDTLTGNDTITTSLREGLKIVEIIERIYKVRDLNWKKQR
ncbi:Gfo/Idh/MocA family protein [Paludibacter jiangxiensis]|uniref:Predicted dehydrogenase n=1 Tax=Paludibacter jiangxiensis TaxID=681398 RepID=A0A161LCQ9_9BACT|nr:Gfo/Idh/MocA family oxidoreductase [Paludibacter jiangxiensis]GAT61685.1 predicted dehydrogenase [Paludibacter jiangxiensis]